jgi:hypothetical protein
VDNVSVGVNLLEKTARKNNIVITGVTETYAERMKAAPDGDIPAAGDTSDDTVAQVCTVLKKACNVNISVTNILTAMRLQSKNAGPRQLLVTFHSSAVRVSIISH